MQVITDRPVITLAEWNEEDHSNFLTKKMRERGRQRRATRKRQRSGKQEIRKSRRTSRKATRQANRAQRQAVRKAKNVARKNRLGSWWQARKAKWSAAKLERQAKRKARKNARKLTLSSKMDRVQAGTEADTPIIFTDELPEVNMQPDGTAVKNLPDGTQEIVDPTNIQTIQSPTGEPVIVDINDTDGRNIVFDEDIPVVEYTEDEVIEIVDENGQEAFVREKDTEEKGWKSLKTWQKGAIIGGSVLVLVGGIYLIVKASKPSS